MAGGDVPAARSICDINQPPKMSPAGFVSRAIATVRIAGSFITARVVEVAESPLARKELRQLAPIHFARRVLGQRLDEVKDLGNLEGRLPAGW